MLNVRSQRKIVVPMAVIGTAIAMAAGFHASRPANAAAHLGPIPLAKRFYPGGNQKAYVGATTGVTATSGMGDNPTEDPVNSWNIYTAGGTLVAENSSSAPSNGYDVTYRSGVLSITLPAGAPTGTGFDITVLDRYVKTTVPPGEVNYDPHYQGAIVDFVSH